MITKMKKDHAIKVVVNKELYDKIVETSRKLGISQAELLRQGALLYMSLIDGGKMHALSNTQDHNEKR